MSADSVALFACDPEGPEATSRLGEYRAMLSAEELARANAFRFERDRTLFVVSHALCRVVLGEAMAIAPRDLKFVRTATGRPELDPAHHSELRFNLAHTRGCVALAMTHGRSVGVDVERSEGARDDLAISRRFFGPDEHAYLSSADGDALPERFLELWTLKEAYLKARGVGLLSPLDSIRFSLDGESPSYQLSAEDGSGWAFTTFRWRDFRLAVALESSQPPPFQLWECVPLVETRPLSARPLRVIPATQR